jgi:hypothetical protein
MLIATISRLAAFPSPPNGWEAQARRPRGRSGATEAQLTPSFFCSEEEEVVYWNRSFLPGYTIR